MKKKILLVISALLCLTMLLAACGKKSTGDFNSIVKADWAGMGKDKIPVLSTEGKQIAVKGDYCLDANESYLVTVGYVESTIDPGTYENETYVYDLATGNLMVTLTNFETPIDSERTRVTEYYVDLIDENNFAVLSIAYEFVKEYGTMYEHGNSNDADFFSSGYFRANTIPGFKLEEALKGQYDVEINMNHTIAVYEGASTTAVNTFDWETIKDWTDEDYDDDYFDTMYEIVVRNLYTEYEEEEHELGFDLILKGTKVYKVDDDGNETLVKDFGVSALPYEICQKTDKYYIACDYEGDVYTYYNDKFEQQFIYTAPNYGAGSSVYVLNNGNLLVQYAKGLEADEKKYDYHEVTYIGETRYDLVTLIVDPTTGEGKEIDFDYYIINVDIAYSADTEAMCWADGVENIVYASEIGKDKLIREDAAAIDWISMTNEGKVNGSVKFDDTLATAPKAYSGKYLAAENLNGDTVIYTADGKVVNTINGNNSSLRIEDDKYIIQTKKIYDDYGDYRMEDIAMYDIVGNKLYDFDEKKAEIEGYINDYDAFITKYYEKGIATYDVVFEGKVVDTFTVKGDEYISCGNNSGYYRRHVETGVDTFEYRLYNAKGEQIMKSENSMYVAYSDDDKIIVYVEEYNKTTSEYELKVYTFAMVKA